MKRTRGFTMIELIVVIAITALLVALLMPALSRARTAAKQLCGMSGLRQMLVGYTVYQHDFGGQVLFGYTPQMIAGRPVTVAWEGGTFDAWIADRYPWRLAPYVGGVWEILHSHGETPPRPLPSDPDSVAWSKAYALSITPTFGLNSAYVGGDKKWAGFVQRGGVDVPNVGRHVVFRNQEVRRPSGLLVFAESQARNMPFDDPQTGMFYLTPPHAAGHWWRADAHGFELLSAGQAMGLPEGRYGPATITGFFDGHVALLAPAELDDMRLWANWADSPAYDFAP